MKLLFIILLSTRIFTDLRLFSINFSFLSENIATQNWHQLQADYESFTEYNHGRDRSASRSFSSYSSSSFALFSDPHETDLSPLPFNRTLLLFSLPTSFISIITDLQIRFHLIKAFHVASPTWHNHIAERFQTQHFSCRWEWIFINKFVGWLFRARKLWLELQKDFIAAYNAEQGWSAS